VGYELEYDSGDGDKCRGVGAGNWTPPVGCQDSLYVVLSLNGPGRAPRVVKATCHESPGHTSAWGSYVEKCMVETVEGDTSKHSKTVLYNERTGEELEVQRVLHWGHAGAWTYFKCDDAASAPSTIFGVGDTIRVRNPTRGSPQSVMPASGLACSVSLLRPPSMPPRPP